MMSPLEIDMSLLLCIIPLLWAAVTDLRKRIIPDWTWIAILLIGGASAFLFSYPTPVQRIAGFLLPGLCLLLLAMKYGGVGGGDIKLTAAMGFCFGMNTLATILFFAMLPACVYAKVTRNKSVPLAVFLFSGLLLYCLAAFVNSLMS